MESLEWPGQASYNRESLTNLTLSGINSKPPTLEGEHKKTIGEVKSNGNFTFVRLHDGGHMIPFDQPEASLDVFNRWLAGEWW